MKKLLIIFSLIIAVAVIKAQDATSFTKTLKSATTWDRYVGLAGDTVSNNRDSLAFVYKLNKEYPVQYYIYLDIDTVSSSSTTIKLQGKVFDDESWTDISSVSFGGTADTTFVFSYSPEITKAITYSQGEDSIINGTNAITVSLGTYAYLDTSTLDTVVTGWTFTPVADTSIIKKGAYTVTETLTTNVKYYRRLRILMIESGTGKTELQLINLKIWRREN